MPVPISEHPARGYWKGRGTTQERGSVKEDCIQAEAIVTACHEAGKFSLQLDGSEHEVLGHLAGRLRKNRIRVIIGDHVRCEMSPYDMGLARITYRFRD